METRSKQGIAPERLVPEYGSMVAALARRMIRDPVKAEDAAQEVWEKVVKSLPSFRGESKLSTWIYTIARRVILKFAKNERIYSTRFLHGFFEGEPRDPAEAGTADRDVWIRDMCDRCLTGILHCLSNEERLMYIFRDLAGLEYSEIAAVMGMGQDAVRKTVSRNRRKLKNFLNRECVLFNPASVCRCRMAGLVEGTNLAAEYEKMRETGRRARFFKETNKILPGKNYWEKFLV